MLDREQLKNTYLSQSLRIYKIVTYEIKHCYHRYTLEFSSYNYLDIYV